MEVTMAERTMADQMDQVGGELSPLQTAWRHRYAIVLFAFAMAALMYGALKLVKPTYVSTASVVLDASQLQVMNSQNQLFSAPTLGAELMRSEMEILNSTTLARQVVDRLNLSPLHDFQLCTGGTGLLDTLGAKIGFPGPQTCKPDAEHAALQLLGPVMAFSNDQKSYVVKLAATTHDPVLSARIANTYAEVYFDWRRDRRSVKADEADGWLSTYLAGLHARMESANAAVETYRQSHHLVPVSPTLPGAAPQTVVTDSLTQLNQQLNTTDAELAQAEATLDQSRAGVSSATALASPMVQNLLERRAEASALLEELRARYGDEHPKVLSAAAQVRRLDAQIGPEVQRSVASLNGQVRALNARHAMLEREVDVLQNRVAGQSQADVGLDELTRDAATENTLYSSMLQRMKEIDAERHIQLSDAEIAVRAIPSAVPAYPHKAMMVAGAFLASLGIGAGLAFARETNVRRFRDVRQIEGEIGVPVLGAFARVPRGTTPRELVLDMPLAAETEMLNSILARLETRARPEGGRVMMVTSALPSEGKSSFGLSLGRIAALAGVRTILLDGDLRRSSLRGMIDAAHQAGPSEGRAVTIERKVHVDQRSGLAMMSLASVLGDARRIIAANGLDPLLDGLRDRYDLIIMDTPPVLAVPDTCSLVPFADDVVLMVDWTATPREAVRAAIAELRRARARVTGIVLSKLGLKAYAAIAQSPVYDIRRYRDYFSKIAA